MLTNGVKNYTSQIACANVMHLYLAPVHNMKVKINRLVSPGDAVSSTRQ